MLIHTFIRVNHTFVRIVLFYLRIFSLTIICLVAGLPLVWSHTSSNGAKQPNRDWIETEKLAKCNIWSGTKYNRVNSWVDLIAWYACPSLRGAWSDVAEETAHWPSDWRDGTMSLKMMGQEGGTTRTSICSYECVDIKVCVYLDIWRQIYSEIFC